MIETAFGCGGAQKTAGLPLQPYVGGTYGFSSPALLGDKALVLSGGDSSAKSLKSNCCTAKKSLNSVIKPNRIFSLCEA